MQWQKRTQNYVALKTYDFNGSAWKESSLVILTSWTIVESLKHNLLPIANLFFVLFYRARLSQAARVGLAGYELFDDKMIN